MVSKSKFALIVSKFYFSLFVLSLTANAYAAAPSPVSSENWIGAAACKQCHTEEYKAWTGSHHDLAMQVVSDSSVLGDFNNTYFDYGDIRTQFSRRDGEYWVNTDGPEGKLQDYKVEYVFGIHPLQQYLLALPGGRLHALNVAWDSRTKEEGGQRWFHLYPDEVVDSTDPLHWTGPYQNWNARCAECHSTNLQKNFDPRSAEYSTTWSEVNVACESCHGPGKEHQLLAESGSLGKHATAGFPVDLSNNTLWRFAKEKPIAETVQTPPTRPQQVESCGRCHSRRGTLGDYHYGTDLLDTHRLSLLDEPLYHLDGQIRDEVYVYGSFAQSKMYQSGVVCSNCHDPHSLELKTPGNGVCAQCHRTDVYDTPKHHHHVESSAGAQCANCHMPETTYMVVDPRRDHSMRVPRPDLSVVVGTPNACTQCHSDQSDQWALETLREWDVSFTNTSNHAARIFQRSRKGDARAVPGLEAIAMDGAAAPIWRATATVELGGYSNREAYDTALAMLSSEDPVLRLAAVRALEFVPPQQLASILSPHLNDPTTAVRVEIARVLASLPLDQVDPSFTARLQPLFEEYLRILGTNADMPETQLQFGIFFTARQYWQPAEKAYQRALQLNPQFLPALLNLADLYRTLGKDKDARELLQRGIEVAPDQGAAYHALGLLESRNGQREKALEYLAQAAQLEETGIRHRYVYAIALHDYGRQNASIDQLKVLLRNAPHNLDVLMALVTYNQQLGQIEEARRYAARLRELSPDDPNIRRLYDSL